MPRRYIDYPEAFAYWNSLSTLGAFLSFLSFLFFLGTMVWTLTRGRRLTVANPWNEHADTLEWTLPSPRPNTRSRCCPPPTNGTAIPAIETPSRA